MKEYTDDNGVKWFEDGRGNKNSVIFHRTEEEAKKALESLIDCDNCINCSSCTYCSSCRYCSSCSDCRYCSSCSYCSDCRYCSSCTYCSSCRYCSSCSDCSDCRYCSSCTYCSSCRYCSSCSSCRYCSSCTYCSSCSDCRYCSSCKNLLKVTHKDKETGDFVPPIIPKIENIHQVVYDAVSKPDALNMRNWHTCNTTHCRAGWVVHLAGEAGYALERHFGEGPLAAQLIYRESGYQINPCRFYDNNDDAMADMKKLAGVV